jgi:5,10-methylenetetrahydromethanopterin reductase
LAEGLGYDRAWVYDTPALQVDPWMTLARAAERTSTIGLGVASITPGLRHAMVTASAIASLAELAPGRTAHVVGTGFTSRRALGHGPLKWLEVERFISDLRALLAGKVVEVDGAPVQMLHGPGQGLDRPIDVPILVAALGPKGRQVAERAGDGIVGFLGPTSGFDWSVFLVFGTVLDDGEGFDSPRVRNAAGPAAAVVYHFLYEAGFPNFDELPNSAAWRKQAEAVTAEQRHLALHRGHLTALNEWDEQAVDASSIQYLSLTDTAAGVRAKVDAFAQGGTTEISFQPIGDDPARELAAFYKAVKGI